MENIYSEEQDTARVSSKEEGGGGGGGGWGAGEASLPNSSTSPPN